MIDKAFNRTGFPTIKKKRKKLSPSTEILVQQQQQQQQQHQQQQQQQQQQPKRAKLVKEDDVHDAEMLPEVHSSESPSSDELVAVSAKKRRVPSWRKRYLTAGLFSNFFKENHSPNNPCKSFIL